MLDYNEQLSLIRLEPGEAELLRQSGWWKSRSPSLIAGVQLFVEPPICPIEAFQNSLAMTLRADLSAAELARAQGRAKIRADYLAGMAPDARDNRALLVLTFVDQVIENVAIARDQVKAIPELPVPDSIERVERVGSKVAKAARKSHWWQNKEGGLISAERIVAGRVLFENNSICPDSVYLEALEEVLKRNVSPGEIQTEEGREKLRVEFFSMARQEAENVTGF
jgi:hypothetical protein